MDYFLSSDLMEPPDGDAHYTERLVRLPQLGLCYLPEERPGLTLDRAALGLRPAGPVFWSGQALYKYRPLYDAVFPRIAAAVGRCQFVFIGFAKSRAVTAAFRAAPGHCLRGVRAWMRSAYCVILPPMSPERFRRRGGGGGRGARYAGLVGRQIDAGLPGAGSGDRDAGPGGFMRGRHTAAILRRIGCEATIAGSLDEYVAIAARLGLDPAWRTQMRQAVARGKARCVPGYGVYAGAGGIHG